VIGEDRRADGERALRLASQLGHQAHPATEVSLFFIDEPPLLAAYQEGWEQRAYELRVRTDAELESEIAKMNEAAARGCGQFYELFERKFTAAATSWLKRLPGPNLARAQELLKRHSYSPNERGYWRYDVEENDITFVPD
jgi:hypothetical protein